MTTYIVIGITVALVLLLCFALAIASFSTENYLEKLKETENMRNTYGISTLDFVSKINEKHFSNQIRVEKCEKYKDHYSHNKIALSEDTMSSNSLASLSIVSHELGHARQDFEGDNLIKHWKNRSFGKKFGYFFMPFLIIGTILSFLNLFQILQQSLYLYIGLGCISISFFIFIFALILKYKEIKIEKEASTFALDYLREYLTEIEIEKCKEFLDSARLTYWAALLKTLLGWTALTSKNKMFR